ncbi:hypothetical protein B0H66DRAFT_250364 [Apodospora peruviana]|uniref:Uncharacterized protein n=1 Tax=Apodospora peruviana TaxID=516989 RepID=A0AAE0I5I3_9PEZI|nr:hypothetical protein B0H66DRAFT_250364 [Apodospora peruviana]
MKLFASHHICSAHVARLDTDLRCLLYCGLTFMALGAFVTPSIFSPRSCFSHFHFPANCPSPRSGILACNSLSWVISGGSGTQKDIFLSRCLRDVVPLALDWSGPPKNSPNTDTYAGTAGVQGSFQRLHGNFLVARLGVHDFSGLYSCGRKEHPMMTLRVFCYSKE